MQEIAASPGGQCLSQAILIRTAKLRWKCHLGHVWQALPHNIKKGRWCPDCARLERTKNRNKRKRYGFEG
ncbi:hypothetical protein AWB73_02847 [Caballeronia turbans]|jgi:peptide methionine sulfoxide reductase MsrB|uniref:zinc-ribbon domain-containing protein n=1 Tax=Caballeronia sp. INML2 TaxID=2921748 RepID=UPI00074BABC3|nr:hypothetical protein [Caballeronia sp. INML2]SAL32163.1 hypothetical protein AWB73_02847 [Caballeronia turbans]